MIKVPQFATFCSDSSSLLNPSCAKVLVADLKRQKPPNLKRQRQSMDAKHANFPSTTTPKLETGDVGWLKDGPNK